MKLLCIYDPAIIFPVPYDWPTVMDAQDAFYEHNTAQDFFGFKVAITDIMEYAIACVPNGTPATAGGMTGVLWGYLTGPERNQRFYFVVMDDTAPSFSPQGDVLSPHSSDSDIQDVYDDLRYLLGWCQRNHPGKARYASWRVDQGRGTDSELVGIQDERIPIVRSRHDWGEAYRQLRRPPANLLPNAFTSASADEVVFAFCPPESFLEDEQDLPRPRLPRDMVESGRWREVGGGQRGHKDRWGNFWIPSSDQRHWDVQITESMQRAINAPNCHLNVGFAGARARSDDAPLDGRIVEGFQPDPDVMHRYFSVRQAS